MKTLVILSAVLLQVVINGVSGDAAAAAAASGDKDAAAAAAAAAATTNDDDVIGTPSTTPPPPSCATLCQFSSPYYDPVCSNDKQTYYNICYLNCENKHREHVGLKPLWTMYESACLYVYCKCSSTYAPVCDVYGNSYFNKCYLDCASRQSIADNYGPLEYYHNGLCYGDPCACPFVHEPLCAYDGLIYQTFGNQCLLNCENKKRKSENRPLMKYQYPGECKTVVIPPKCTDDCKYQPKMLVCGSNYVTYYNVCYLNCASLEAIQNGQKPIFIRHIGHC